MSLASRVWVAMCCSSRADGAAQGVLVALMSAFGADEAGQVGVGFCLVHQQRVVRRQGLGFAERQHGVADVPDLPGFQGGGHDVVDEAGLALQGLPHVPVEAPVGQVADDLDFLVQVALADDASFALVDVGGTPGSIEVVQGHGAVLHVGADAHLLGRADQDSDVPGPARGEQPGQVGIGLRLVHEPDGLPGQPARGKLVAELVVDVPPRSGGTQVTEHELQRPAHRVRSSVRCPVFVVAVSFPDRGDPVGGRRHLARNGLR